MPKLPAPHRKRLPQIKRHEYSKWYHLPLWRKLRQQVMERDAWTCKACGKPTGASGNCDHIEPHKGNWELFVAMHNLQALCQSCHSRKSATE